MLMVGRVRSREWQLDSRGRWCLKSKLTVGRESDVALGPRNRECQVEVRMGKVERCLGQGWKLEG